MKWLVESSSAGLWAGRIKSSTQPSRRSISAAWSLSVKIDARMPPRTTYASTLAVKSPAPKYQARLPLAPK